MIPLGTIPRRKSYFAAGSIFRLAGSIAGAAPRGEAVAKFESALKKTLRLPNPCAVSSGRLALRLILETSGLEPGREILMPAYTFGLLYPAVRASGFVPVAVDIDPATFQIDPLKTGEAITERTGAVLATHLFGEPCDVDAFRELCNSRGLLMIEDCAQAPGARSRGWRTGTVGDAAFMSLDVSKTLNGIRGGVVITRDDEWAARLRARVEHEMIGVPDTGYAVMKALAEHVLIQSPAWRVVMIATGSERIQKALMSVYRHGETGPGAAAQTTGLRVLPLDGALAGLALMNLATLDERHARRREIRALYMELLSDVLEFQKIDSRDEGAVHMVVARSPVDVGRLKARLAVAGIDIGTGNEIADVCSDDAEETKRFAAGAVCLPVHCGMTDRTVRYVSEKIRTVMK